MPNLNPLSGKFGSSAERDAMFGALGFAASAVTIPFTPQVIGKYSNIVYGVALIVAGMYIKHDGLGYLVIGAGVGYLLDGAVRLVFPSLATANTAAYAQLGSQLGMTPAVYA